VLSSYPRRGRFYRAVRLTCAGFVGIADHLPRKGTVVDLGTGEGLFAHVLARRSPDLRVVAVDHHAPRVERLKASAEGTNIDAVCASMQTYELPPCEGVALVDVMHYLDAGTQEALLRNAYRALLPGGTLVMRDPDRAAGLRFFVNRVYERTATTIKLTRASIGNYRRVADWTETLKRIGFETVEAVPHDAIAITADRMLVAKKGRGPSVPSPAATSVNGRS
jgi:SAM-dependent methyltransferase